MGLDFPGYEQDHWIAASKYNAAAWTDLVELMKIGLRRGKIITVRPEHDHGAPSYGPGRPRTYVYRRAVVASGRLVKRTGVLARILSRCHDTCADAERDQPCPGGQGDPCGHCCHRGFLHTRFDGNIMNPP